MESDKSKVYTVLNADELKLGSGVIVADTLKDLKNKVEMGGYGTKLLRIEPDDREQINMLREKMSEFMTGGIQ